MIHTSLTTHEGGMRCRTVFESATREELCTDVATAEGGLGQEPSPGDALAAVVASCMLSMVAHTGARKGFETKGINIAAKCGEGKQGVGSLEFEIKVPMKTSSLERRMIEAAVANCPVGNSLHPDIPKTIRWDWAE